MSSMQFSLCPIWKQMYTDPTSSDPLQTSRMTKSDTKWKRSSDTKNEGEDIDTMLSGKDIRLRKHRGNQQRVLMAVAKKSSTSISAVTTSKPPPHEPKTQATLHTTTVLSSTCHSKSANSQRKSHPADSSEKSLPCSKNPLPLPPKPSCLHIPCSHYLVIDHCLFQNPCAALHSKMENDHRQATKFRIWNNNSDMYNILRIWWTKC